MRSSVRSVVKYVGLLQPTGTGPEIGARICAQISQGPYWVSEGRPVEFKGLQI